MADRRDNVILQDARKVVKRCPDRGFPCERKRPDPKVRPF
jgi:hypothetical protein